MNIIEISEDSPFILRLSDNGRKNAVQIVVDEVDLETLSNMVDLTEAKPEDLTNRVKISFTGEVAGIRFQSLIDGEKDEKN